MHFYWDLHFLVRLQRFFFPIKFLSKEEGASAMKFLFVLACFVATTWAKSYQVKLKAEEVQT
jgi:hypothetical protein